MILKIRDWSHPSKAANHGSRKENVRYLNKYAHLIQIILLKTAVSIVEMEKSLANP